VVIASGLLPYAAEPDELPRARRSEKTCEAQNNLQLRAKH